MMTKSRSSIYLTALGLLALLHAGASAQTTFFSADTTTGYFDTPGDGAEFGTSFDNISNGNGLTIPVADLTSGNIGSTSHTLGFISGNTVVRDGAGAATITAEFGFVGATDITSIYVWNYTQPGCCENRGIADYQIYLDTGGGFGAVHTTGTLASATHIDGSHFAQEIDLGGTQGGVIGVRLVGLNNFGGNAIGIDEVVFSLEEDPGEPLAPTGIFLSLDTVNESGALSDSILGTLSSADLNVGESFTYELVSGDGDTDNAAFEVVGNALSFLLDTAAGDYSVRLRTTDSDNLTFEQAIAITVIANQAPSALNLLPAVISLNLPAPQRAGAITFDDPNFAFTPGDSHRFALAVGEGDEDNGLFTLDPGSGVLTFGGTPTEGALYAVRVAVTDSTTLTTEAAFTVEVLNLAGPALEPRAAASDGSTLVFQPNNVPMPAGASVGQVGVFVQDAPSVEGAIFRMYLLRPTGGDSYDIVYDSGEITITGRTTGEVAVLDFPNGSVTVQEGDIFAHYGRGIPYSAGVGLPIYWPVIAAPIASPEEPLSVNLGPTSDPEFPYNDAANLTRDYAWAVLLEGGLVGPTDLTIDYHEGTNMVTLRWTAEAGRLYAIDGTVTLESWPDDFEDSFEPATLDAEFSLTRPEADDYFFRIRDAGPAAP